MLKKSALLSRCFSNSARTCGRRTRKVCFRSNWSPSSPWTTWQTGMRRPRAARRSSPTCSSWWAGREVWWAPAAWSSPGRWETPTNTRCRSWETCPSPWSSISSSRNSGTKTTRLPLMWTKGKIPTRKASKGFWSAWKSRRGARQKLPSAGHRLTFSFVFVLRREDWVELLFYCFGVTL